MGYVLPKGNQYTRVKGEDGLKPAGVLVKLPPPVKIPKPAGSTTK